MQLTPIIPFEPMSTDTIPQGNQWMAQIKWDGVRILTYYDGKVVRLFNRRLNERTNHYPELQNINHFCNADSVILDGEIIALGPNGKPSFHEVMRRDGLRRLEKVSQVQSQVPISYMIFDIVFHNGEWVNHQSLQWRLELLQKIIKSNETVQLVTSYENSEHLFQIIKEQEMEGIVIKDKESKYIIGGKNNHWQKRKYYRDVIAVVGGVTLRDGTVNALILGLYDNQGNLWYIGHAGTGKLKKEDWRTLTQEISTIIIKERPFINKPERMKEAIWLKPYLTVKVQFSEWTPGHTLRHPSIQSFMDLPPEQCLLELKMF